MNSALCLFCLHKIIIVYKIIVKDSAFNKKKMQSAWIVYSTTIFSDTEHNQKEM